MILIADCESTHTEWAIVDGCQIFDHADTSGLNPFFQTRREISHIIRLELPEHFFRTKFEHVYFYGAGCANPNRNKIVESSLIAQFRMPVTVNSDLVGAAYGLLQRSPGIACILGTGANSCFYDGQKIVKNTTPGGYLLGDEGSSAYMGKLLVSDVLKEIAPVNVVTGFYEMFGLTADEVMDMVYTEPNVSRKLSEFSRYLAENLNVEYCRDLVLNSFRAFFKRNILTYGVKNYPLSVVGPTACTYRSLFAKAAAEYGITIKSIEPSSLYGLMQYHAMIAEK